MCFQTPNVCRLTQSVNSLQSRLLSLYQKQEIDTRLQKREIRERRSAGERRAEESSESNRATYSLSANGKKKPTHPPLSLWHTSSVTPRNKQVCCTALPPSHSPFFLLTGRDFWRSLKRSRSFASLSQRSLTCQLQLLHCRSSSV